MRKKILVAGAGRGIGKVVAELAKKKGYYVTAVSRGQTDSSPEYNFETFNLTDHNNVSRLNNHAQTTDVVVNCTGTHPGERNLSDLNAGDLMNVLGENLVPALHIYQAFLQTFRDRGHGHFVHISSAALEFNSQGEAIYSASKAALETFVRSFQTKDLSDRTGVLHHVVRVSLTDTPLARRVCPEITDWGEFYTPEETARYILHVVERPSIHPNLVVTPPIRPMRT